MRSGAKGAPEGKKRGRGASAFFPPSLRPPRKRATLTKRRRFLCARASTRAARALLALASPLLPSQATLEMERLGRLSLALDPSGAVWILRLKAAQLALAVETGAGRGDRFRVRGGLAGLAFKAWRPRSGLAWAVGWAGPGWAWLGWALWVFGVFCAFWAARRSL